MLLNNVETDLKTRLEKEGMFFASNNSKKLHPKMEKVASPFWRKLQAARQGCQSAAQTALQTYH